MDLAEREALLRLAADLVRSHSDYVGLTDWINDDVPIPDAEKIAEAILRLPQLPERVEGAW